MEKSSELRTGVAEVTAPDFQGLVTAFIEASLSDSRRAEEIRAKHRLAQRRERNDGIHPAPKMGSDDIFVTPRFAVRRRALRRDGRCPVG